MAYLRAVIRVLVGVPALAATALGVVLLSWLPVEWRGIRLSAWVFSLGSRTLLRCIGLRFCCQDPQWVARHRGFIFSNHVSFFDILVMSYLVPARFVSKAEVRKWPFIGVIAASTGTVFVDRADRTKRADVRQAVAASIRETQYPPIVVFPEGTRNPEDSLLPFRYGVFEIAAETAMPYLLCAIHYEDTEAMTWHSQKESLVTTIRRIVMRDTTQVWLIPLEVVQPAPGDDPQVLAEGAREVVGRALAAVRANGAPEPCG